MPTATSSQLKALLSKNVNLYRRDSSRLLSELCLIVMYYAILVVLALTSGSSELVGPMAVMNSSNLVNPGGLGGAYADNLLCASQGYNEGCFLGFSDERNGCSQGLRDFMESLPLCHTNSSSLPACKCIKHVELETFEAVADGKLAAGVVFNPADFHEYTVHVPDFGVHSETDRVWSPRAGERWDMATFESWRTPVVALSAEINMHLVRLANGTEVRIDVQKMGREAYERTSKAGLMNFPFYLTYLFVYGGCLALVNSAAGEREKKLEQGMYMLGLRPITYWWSWAIIGLLKQAFTVILGIILSKVVLVPKNDWFIMFLFYCVYAVYCVAFALTCAAFMQKAKHAAGLLSMYSLCMAAPVYINVMLFLNESATAIIPPWIILLFGSLFAPFSFAHSLAIFVLNHDERWGGVQWHNFFAKTRLEVSLGQCFFCLLGATALQFVALFAAIRLQSGPSTFTKQQGGASAVTVVPTSAPDSTWQEADVEANPVAVSICGLRKSFGGVIAVDGLSVDFYANQITSFLGHNGAGKTTTIQLLTGLHRPTGGDAFIFGKSIMNDMVGVRESISVCPQENLLWDLLTVREHIMLYAGLRGLKEGEADAIKFLEEVGLQDKVDSRSKDLSGGQQRKLQVALALVGEPKVVFLDEPTAGMDSQARREIWKLLDSKKAGRAIILTTHHMDEADILGDRIAVIDAGHLQVAGTSDDLKGKFAVGHHLEVSLGERADRRAVLSAVRAVHEAAAPTEVELGDQLDESARPEEKAAAMEAALSVTGAGDLRLLVPLHAEPYLGRILSQLEEFKAAGSHGVEDFGIASTTLDDVFWRLGRQGELSRRQAKQPRAVADTAGGADPLAEGEAEVQRPGTLGMLRLLLGLRSMIRRRNVWQLLLEIFLPLVMIGIGIGLLFVDFIPEPRPPEPIALDAMSALAPTGDADTRFVLPVVERPDGGDLSVFSELVPLMERLGRQSDDLPVVEDATREWEQADLPCIEAWLIGTESCEEQSISELPAPAVPEPRVGAMVFGRANVSTSGHAPNDWAAVVAACPGFEAWATTDGANGGTPNAVQVANICAQDWTTGSAGCVTTVLAGTSQVKSTWNQFCGPPPAGIALPPTNGSIVEAPLVHVHFNSSILFSLPGLVAHLCDALLSGAKGGPTLRPKFQALPPKPATPEEEVVKKRMRAQMQASIAPLFMAIGLVLLPPLVVFDLVTEKASGVRHLQVLMGVRLSEYWLGNFVFDFASRFVIVVCGGMVLFAIAQTSLACVETFLLLTMYLVVAFPMSYLISTFFGNETHEKGSETGKRASSRTSALSMLGFFIAFMGYFVLSMPGVKIDEGVLEALRWVGMIISPAAAFAMGLRGVLLSKAFDVNALSLASVDATIMTWGGEQEVTVETAGGPLLIMFLQGLIFGVALAVKEMRALKDDCGLCALLLHRIQRKLCCCCRRRSTVRKKLPSTEELEDEDVRREREQVDDASLDAGADAVRLVHLRKSFYPRGDEEEGTTAVADLCVRMRRGECFALLGTNGAGKSTTIGMILRMFLPTSGKAYIEGVDVSAGETANSLFVNMGYVPQQNAIYERLTGREMLLFFCSVRGIQKQHLSDYVSRWLEMADLASYADRPCGTYSGGNKRKLQLAIALCGDPRLTVLDEPSAGVDPAARRKLWGVVNRSLAKGRTVVLTTHHMDEAAHLGHRIGIMVRGRLTCLGSPLHLKSRYGGGYDVAVRVSKGVNVDEQVLPLITKLCPTATVRESPATGYIKVSLGHAGKDFPLVQLYEELEKAKATSGVESFVATQADLEDVFLRILRMSGEDPSMDLAEAAEAAATGLTTFDEALNYMRSPDDKPSREAPAERQLRLYAAYKQATDGDVQGKEPCGPEAKAKWKAWKDLKGRAKEDAEQIFIDEAKQQTLAQLWSKRYVAALA